MKETNTPRTWDATIVTLICGEVRVLEYKEIKSTQEGKTFLVFQLMDGSHRYLPLITILGITFWEHGTKPPSKP